jgi:ADP-L-glycero-D-manno-heptose 6-epimerase
MIVVTGAAGFIGSCLLSRLNSEGYNAIAVVDAFASKEKEKNLAGKNLLAKVDREDFFDWIRDNHMEVEFVFHLGARTDTAETDIQLFDALNTGYSKKLWQICIDYQLPVVYASSAATYGLGEYGYSDDHDAVRLLKPLNAYGESKNEFDLWVLQQPAAPYFWAGLKFFNVYGPNEYHKGRMASVVYHAFHKIRDTGRMELFRSHRTDIADGAQRRDFIYVKDVVDVCMFLMHHRKDSGIYNLGTGTARTFLELTRAVFRALDMEENIRFIDTPEDIRHNYQYFTEARMEKLRGIGYAGEFRSLEDGVDQYVRSYLLPHRYM